MPDDNDNDDENKRASIVSLEDERRRRGLQQADPQMRARTVMILEGFGLIAQAILGPVVRELAREVTAPEVPERRKPKPPKLKTWCIPTDMDTHNSATGTGLKYCALARKPPQYPGKFFRTLCGRDILSKSVPAIVAHAPNCPSCAERLAELAERKRASTQRPARKQKRQPRSSRRRR